jgi:lipid II:glycine glycyltransferase (peptidoglycan interpeptide bridge formation enzyme)
MAKDEFLRLRPHNALVWHAIKWAINNNFKQFSFGFTYPQRESLLRFKEKWGGVSDMTNHYYFLVKDCEIPQFEKKYNSFSLAKKIYRKLPLSVVGITGGVVRRWVC